MAEALDQSSPFLPAEIIIHILSYLQDQPLRQHTLNACCLVSRLWYSAALPLLYERPYISGNNFDKFALAICPPAQAYAPRGDLGRFVRRLDFSRLVHHLSTSTTTRFLGRCKEGLEIFIAPASGFSAVNLTTLSKCTALRSLDLLHVRKPLDLPSIKKAIHRMPNLRRLRLPSSTDILSNPHPPSKTSTSSSTNSPPWPSQLRKLEISGRLDPTIMPTFDYPPALTSLTLAGAALQPYPPSAAVVAPLNNHPSKIPFILSNPHLQQHLRRLRIPYASHNRHADAEGLPHYIPNLHYLSIQGDLIQPEFFRECALLREPLPLEILAFEQAEGFPEFSERDLREAVEAGLGNLRLVGFHESYAERLEGVEEEVEEVLRENAVWKGWERDEIERGEVEVGVYYFD
ncbi:hypothetical protein AJ79_02607 [Helicocarpus griseus UAMH5409]|uniref:F-box domain-containing protein n=1 Tax=Helicocarpus griseus UAMH5409 TaxID=1447875 RepID=A0A2B7Y210_9EURO|nr:hypothetical protein AJ79_02607 [Helicocarpus griseus UAMH5409]